MKPREIGTPSVTIKVNGAEYPTVMVDGVQRLKQVVCVKG